MTAETLPIPNWVRHNLPEDAQACYIKAFEAALSRYLQQSAPDRRSTRIEKKPPIEMAQEDAWKALQASFRLHRGKWIQAR